MSEENNNPYQAPESDVFSADMGEVNTLAGRGSRLVAAIIDGIIMMVVLVPAMFAMGVIDVMMQGEQAALGVTIGYALSVVVVFLLINGYLLNKNGQTVGKYVMGIQIVDLQGNVMPMGRLIGLRYVPQWIVQNIPLVGIIGIVDVLLIFREDRRCIHDLIAGTKVVTVIKE